MRHVIVTHVFDVADDITDEEIHTVVGTMSVQVEEPVVGYSDDLSMNEITIDTTNIDVGVAIEDRPEKKEEEAR